IPKLSADGSNYKKWKAAMEIYAQMLDANDVLNSTLEQPNKPSYKGLIPDVKPLKTSTINLQNPKHVARMQTLKIFYKN
ncbi:hypothetical protein CC86DRAFT_287579, partial [Ophiobolus disseminans]